MRFIRKEHIVTTIFNKDLTKINEINTVFKNLYEQRIDFSIIIRKNTLHDNFSISFEKVRIKKIYDDDTIDIIAFKKGTKTVMKKVSINDIIEVNATTTKHKILDIDSDVDRFDLLDIREKE